MGDNRTELPEGTDTVITGAENLDTDGTGTITTDTALVLEEEIPAPSGDAERPVTGSGSAETGLAARLRSGGEKLSEQAGTRARGLVSQGLERSAEALSNVGRLVGETATGLDERLGAEYGDYARRAASAIENAADSIAAKDADELIDDTREFVRQSPGIAIAGAAIVGFALARLFKTGLDRRGDDEDEA